MTGTPTPYRVSEKRKKLGVNMLQILRVSLAPTAPKPAYAKSKLGADKKNPSFVRTGASLCAIRQFIGQELAARRQRAKKQIVDTTKDICDVNYAVTSTVPRFHGTERRCA